MILLFASGCGQTAGPDLADFAGAPPDLRAPPDLARACSALHFDGLGGSAVSRALPDPSDSFTLEAWILADSGIGPDEVVPLAGRGDLPDLGDGYDLEFRATTVGAFRVSGTGGGATLLSSDAGWTPTAWRHLAGVFDASSAKFSLFLDGHLETSTATRLTALPLAMAPLVIGGVSGRCGCTFIGYVAEVRFSAGARYTEDFTPDRLPVADSSTLALFHLDESGGTTAVDASMSHADAALMNGATFAAPPRCL